MPELPDLEIYAERIAAQARGEVLARMRVLNPFVLRTAVPPIDAVHGRALLDVRRQGKHLVFSFAGDLHLVLHLMRAGRLRWLKPEAKQPARIALAALDFPSGTLLITEAGTRRRAALHLVSGAQSLAAFDAGGIEVLQAGRDDFAVRLRSESHTLKRALTMPRLVSGVGGAYADEILFRARLSPVALTGSLSDEQVTRLFEAARSVLSEWTARLRAEAGDAFPRDVTAFRPEFAVHGRFGKPCPACGATIQRIVYAETETNYCPRCQTGGRILADRALSRLLHKSWPRTVEDLE
jgi:formamidopyrimidine-DNA glycosylase